MSYSFGQDMYPASRLPGDTTSVPGTRPNAGWLYVQSSRGSLSRTISTTSLPLASLARPGVGEVTQRTIHAIAPYYNRPVNWDSQLPFEPGIDFAYDHTQRVLAFGDGKSLGGDIEPHAGASLGNILTEARAGLRFPTASGLHHPWLVTAPTSAPEISLFADATAHGIARNEFLAGTMFRQSDNITAIRGENQVGISIRWQQITVLWMADQLGRRYESRAQGHAWSRLAFDWQFAR